MKIINIVLALILLTSCSSTTIINYDSEYELEADYVLKTAGINETKYINELKEEIKTSDDKWGLGDRYLILARLENNTEYYKKACENFLQYETNNIEEKALLYETLASLNCENERKENLRTQENQTFSGPQNTFVFLREAIKEWKTIGVKWRAKLLQDILENKTKLEFDTSNIKPKLNLSKYDKIIIGKTKIEIKKDDDIIVQVDRVYRDWLGEQIKQSPFSGKILTVFSERLSYDKTELREDIGWHEGGRVKELKETLGIKPITAVGTIAAKHKEKWYAVDEKGIFRFEVPFDKIAYPTTRFLTPEIAIIIDTHGVNMLVEQAVRKKADVVIGCCDHPGKAKAVKYLSDKRIKVICFTDRFLYTVLGHDARAVGSPVWKIKGEKIIYGDSPITLRKNQKIIVTNAKKGVYAIQYYDTPFLYFTEINKTFELNIIPAEINDFYQTEKIYELARENKARIAATRIFNSYDYEQAKKWLKEDERNKIILFHSTSYPYGILLMQEYEGQISFDDVNVEGVIS